jgi:plasmid maintenance system antidote protein VapI
MAVKKKSTADDLRSLVNESGLSRSAIARESGVAQSVISVFMRGKRTITIDTADRIRDALIRLTLK